MIMKRVLSFMLAFMAAFVLMSNANAYEVRFADMQHCTYSALLNNHDFTGGEVNEYDYLVVICKANPGWRFSYNSSKMYIWEEYLYSGLFTDGVYVFQEPDMFAPDMGLNVKLLDATSARIFWTDQSGDFTVFRLWVSGEKLTGNPDYWKNVIETGDYAYEATDLVAGRTYYVYLQGGTLTGYTGDVVSLSFTAQEPGDPCTITIDMTDTYGDGWDGGGGLHFFENGVETFFTLKDGTHGTETYVSNGDPVQIIWEEGYSSSERGFTVTNGEGTILLKVTPPDVQYFSTGDTLFNGYLCQYACGATINGLSWNTGENGKYILGWMSEDADSYEVAVIQKNNPTKEDLEKVAVPVTGETYTFTGKDRAFYKAFVRGICEATGEKGKWSSVDVCRAEYDWNDSIIKAWSKDITLDYVESGELMENALIYSDGGDIYPSLCYHLTLAEETDVDFIFVSTEINNYGFSLLQDTMPGKPLQYLGWMSGNVQRQLKGDFYICLETEGQFGEYTLKIQKPKQLTAKTITLDYDEAGDFKQATDFALPPMGMIAFCKAFKFIPADTVDVLIRLSSSNMSSGVGYLMYQNRISEETFLTGRPAGSSYEGTFLKDTTYYIVVASVPYSGGSIADTYNFSIMSVKTASTPTTAIDLDAYVDDAYSPSNFITEFGRSGKVYEYVAKAHDKIAFTLEAYNAPVDDPSWLENFYVKIYKDTVGGSFVESTDASQSWIQQPITITGSTEGIHYFFVVYHEYDMAANYRLIVRKEQNPDSIETIATIEVGSTYRADISVEDQLDTHFSYGGYADAIKPYKVHLEKDKNYKVFVHTLPEMSTHTWYDDFYIALFDPKVKTGDFWAHVKCYRREAVSDDNWQVLNIEADTTADYTLLLSAYVDRKFSSDYLRFDFAVEEVVDLEELAANSPLVTDNYTVSGTFTDDVKVLPMPTYGFHADPQSWIEENGAFNAVMCGVKVARGDTVFVEFGGDADGMIHIFNPYAPFGPTNPLIINEHPYSYPYEKGFMVNTLTSESYPDTVVFPVIGSFVNVSLDDLAYTFRVATSSQALAPVAVTPKVNKSSITISKTDGVAAAQAELGKLVLTAVPQNGGDVLNLTNNPFEWFIDLDANIARYDFNDADLPLGYVFAGTNPSVEVTIRRGKSGIEEVEEEASVESEVKARKVMINGHILIITPNGTFDMFGRRVE